MNSRSESTTSDSFGLVAWLKETRVSLPLKGVECRFEATGPLLSVEIDQIFHQEHNEPLDCLYSFPLPAGAAVYRCEMHVNDRVISARIEEREKARQIYAEQKAAGHRAALVETERENLFTLSLGNLQPGDLVVVRFAYVQVLERLGRELRARIPVCPGVKYIPGKPLLRDLSGRGSADDTDQVPDASRISPPRIDALHPDAAFFAVTGKIAAQDVAEGTLSSPSHPILARVDGNLHRVELANHGAVPDRDLVVRWEEPAAAALQSYAWEFRDGKQSFALLELRAPAEVAAAEDFEQDFYFLVDRSGSMEGQKWTQACAALHGFVKLLGANDRVWITLFESNFQDFAEAPQSASSLKNDRAFLHLVRLGTAGGTELFPAAAHVGQAIRKHSGGRRAVVILLTDGQVGNESEIVAAFAQSPAAAVHTFGIDTAVNDAFLRELARKNGGECWLLTPNDDVAGIVAKLGHRLRRPVLSGLQMPKKWEPARDKLPDLFEGQAASVSLRGAAGQPTLQITGRFAGGVSEKLSLELTPSTNAALRLVWARDRIGALIDIGKKAAAVTLAKEFNLLCEGVAFIAWDEAERVAIAEHEIYQPSTGVHQMACASIDFSMATPRSPRGLKMLSCALYEAPHFVWSPKRKIPGLPLHETYLGNAWDFFSQHRPAWAQTDIAPVPPPLVPVRDDQALWEWIHEMLQRRGATDECAEAAVAWFEIRQAGVWIRFPTDDADFVEWMLCGGDTSVDDASFAARTREFARLHPVSDPATQRELLDEVQRWYGEVARLAAPDSDS